MHTTVRYVNGELWRSKNVNRRSIALSERELDLSQKLREDNVIKIKRFNGANKNWTGQNAIPSSTEVQCRFGLEPLSHHVSVELIGTVAVRTLRRHYAFPFRSLGRPFLRRLLRTRVRRQFRLVIHAKRVLRTKQKRNRYRTVNRSWYNTQPDRPRDRRQLYSIWFLTKAYVLLS